MQVHAELHCDVHTDPMECPDILVVYREKSGKDGLPVRDGGSSYVVIRYCPWCGGDITATPNDGANSYG
jgi:hypothetical protein